MFGRTSTGSQPPRERCPKATNSKAAGGPAALPTSPRRCRASHGTDRACRWLASLHDDKRGTCQVFQGASCLGRHQPLLDIRDSGCAFTTLTCGSARAFATTPKSRQCLCLPHDPKSRQCLCLPHDPKSIAAASMSLERHVNIRHVSRKNIPQSAAPHRG
jgi:hypothetical protein